jgi:hypothetical protein
VPRIEAEQGSNYFSITRNLGKLRLERRSGAGRISTISMTPTEAVAVAYALIDAVELHRTEQDDKQCQT